jgi:hypothetical protein
MAGILLGAAGLLAFIEGYNGSLAAAGTMVGTIIAMWIASKADEEYRRVRDQKAS